VDFPDWSPDAALELTYKSRQHGLLTVKIYTVNTQSRNLLLTNTINNLHILLILYYFSRNYPSKYGFV